MLAVHSCVHSTSVGSSTLPNPSLLCSLLRSAWNVRHRGTMSERTSTAAFPLTRLCVSHPITTRYFEERFGVDSGALGYISSYTSGLSFVVQVRRRNEGTAVVR